MRPIKNRTYYNFMRVVKLIEAKGYEFQEAATMARRIFDDYEIYPEGLSVLARVDMIVRRCE